MPAHAASDAASALPTTSRACTGAATAVSSLKNVHPLDEECRCEVDLRTATRLRIRLPTQPATFEIGHSRVEPELQGDRAGQFVIWFRRTRMAMGGPSEAQRQLAGSRWRW